MSDLAKHIATLSPEKRQLLLQKMQEKLVSQQLQQKKAGNAQQQIPPQRRNSDKCALSFAQERLWILHELDPQSAAYNMPNALHLRGLLSIATLKQSLAMVIQRHETLRTVFQEYEGKPAQVIKSSLSLQLPVIDLHDKSPREQADLVHQLSRQEAQRPFDLAIGPLLRARILRLDEREHILLFTMHHIITDGWSMSLLIQEFSTLYQAEIKSEPASLPALPIQYADYAFWQRERLQGEFLQKQLDYWRQKLAGTPTVLNLPTDRPRPAVRIYAGSMQTLLLPLALLQNLKQLSQQEEVTLFMTLLAAFQVLLMRYSGETDIVVGSPIANRRQHELESLIGFFVNTLVLRTDLGGNPSFLQLLARVREVALQAYEHQDLPFEKLVSSELAPEQRSLSHSPLFQVLFALQNVPGSDITLADITFHQLEKEHVTTRFDLSLMLIEEEGGLLTEIGYSTELFDEATITLMLSHWQVLLEAIVHDPEQSIETLPLLTPEEREQLLVEWNTTQEAERRGSGLSLPTPLRQGWLDMCLHQLFERLVEQMPDAIAVVFEEQLLTYQQLNGQANQLAYRLWQESVRPDGLVGVCMERSLELVVALLAVLKAGGAYVPFDPNYPQERLMHMLEDTQVPVVLTQAPLHDRLTPFTIKPICVEPGSHLEPRDNLPSFVRPDNLAYLIYTSGSTGKPKGAMNTHRGICNHLSWMQQTHQLTPRDRVLQKTPFSFDVSVWEFFLPLITGARLIVASPGGHQDPAYLKAIIAEQQVTTLHFVPSMLQAFLAEYNQEGCGSLRQVMCGGEALSTELQARFFAQVPEDVQLYNLYGPAEAAIDVTFWQCQREGVDFRVPIGRPITNTQIYLLDKNLQPVAIGVTGELYIGGVGLARGYWRRPGLTAERFIANPFVGIVPCADPGTRLYRTGDLARYQPDGTIEYLGRIDQQVKLRGIRIELGEIEAMVSQYPGVQECVVVLQEEEQRQALSVRKYLVAYVVGTRLNAEPSVEQLHDYLRKQLPDYMVPTSILLLERLPLMPNGKVDRQALPIVDLARRNQNEALVAPTTPLQEVLVTIWKDVLHLPQISIHDNFFALGGHSLLATQAVARIRQTLEVDLPLRSLFEAPTIATLALHLEELMHGTPFMPLPALVPMERLSDPHVGPVGSGLAPDHMQLSFAQERLWFLNQWDPESGWYNVPMALQLEGSLHVKALEQSLVTVVQRHEILRTTFDQHLGRSVQVIAPELLIQIPVIDLSGLTFAERDQQVTQLARTEAHRPFDLAKGPLLRVHLLRLDVGTIPSVNPPRVTGRHVLLFTLHHIVADGWSMGVLARELTTLYRANVSGQPSPLMPLPIQYADYAHWQRKWLQGTTLQEQLAYWKLQLQSVPSLLPLPTDYLRPPEQSSHGATLNTLVPLSLYEQLKTLSQQENITLFMTLLSALAILLGRYSGQHDIVVGTAVANRMHPSIEARIGKKANTLVLRCNLANDPSMRELLQCVREVTIQAYAHQDLPFEKLVEELQPERSLSHHPLFQVMFVLNNQPQIEDHLLDMQISSLVADNQTAKRDLSIAITETPKGLVMSWQYDTTLFAQEKIQRMLNHYKHLLEDLVTQPQRKLSELSLLNQQERDLVLQHWNPAEPEPPLYTTIMQWFDARVVSTPDAIALVCGQQHLSYWDLAERAKRIGHALQRLGVGPEVRVGLYLERSLELLVSLFGILNAGGVYLPLDPSYPRERLAFMIQDAQIKLLLTQHHLRDHFSSSHIHVICLENEWMNLTCGAELSVMQDTQVTAENLAYVIYTSGSTGQPKGAMVTHRTISCYVNALAPNLHVTSQDAYLHTASFSFSSSVRQLFLPLSQGAKVVLALSEQTSDPLHLFTLIQQQQVSVLDLIPSYWRSCIQALQSLEPTTSQKLLENNVRLIVTASEPHPSDLHLKWRQLVAQGTQATMAVVMNTFGQTETGTVATYTLKTIEQGQGANIPIGHPIASCQLYLLDASLQLVPIGVQGEMYVGGVDLARGYLGRPELTAERFIPHPYVGKMRPPGARLYRTGDLARYRPDGTIEYLGRKDRQVKIRGYRIELGEIEAVLGAHPSIQDALVLAREGVRGEKHLVVYLVEKPDQSVAQGTQVTSSDLRLYLQDRLLSSMHPSAYVFLSALPLTAHGKVDWWALPMPEGNQSEEGKVQGEPGTPIEELVMRVWCEILSCTQVGIYDNFFELGGHSLLVIQLIARIRVILGVEIPVRAVFEVPTVAGLAKQVEQALRLGEAIQIPPLVVMERPEEISLSFAQERLWFLDQLEPESTTYLATHALSVEGRLDAHSLEQSLQELIQRHEILRTTFVGARSAQGTIPTGQPAQVIHPAGHYILPVIDLQGLRQEQKQTEVQRLTAQEAQCPCDLARGPLLRTYLLRLEKQEYVLLLTLHHIITDGWSSRVLVRELSTLYHSCMAGQSSPLAPLPIQHADYALWQRQWLQGEILESQLAYWQQQLSGAPALLELPTDHPRKALRTNAGAKLSLLLSPACLQELERVSQQEGVTLFMTLLAAFQVLLMRYSGQKDIVVGTPTANRGQAGLEDLIGFFVNTLVLRSDLSGNPSFRQLLARIREVAVQAYAHQDLPFERLVEALHVERSLSHAPLFQVLFVLQNIPTSEVTPTGITFRQLEREHFTTRFDLSLIVTPGERGLLAEVEYSTDLFDGATITRLLSHWQVLLEAIVHDPEQDIETLPLLTEAEREQILAQGRGNMAQEAGQATPLRQGLQGECVHRLFEQRVEQTPDSVALTFGEDEILTYAELNRRANQLARHLQGLGVGPEVLVGICMQRSIDMVVALLGVLKAGGAYVPLDPTSPVERLAFMMRDTHAPVLLTQEQLPGQMPASTAHVVVLPQMGEIINSQPDENPQSLVSLENLAYIIYTSGSTGVPKGVQVTHRGLNNLRLAQADTFAIGSGSRVLQFASLSFDASVSEMLMALMVNGSLHLMQAERMLPGPNLQQVLQEQAITCVTLPPSALAVLPTSDSLPALQMLVVAGEACSVGLMACWAVGRRFFNAYGPTEATVCASIAACSVEQANQNALSLGQPLRNMQIYVLDRHLQPVPIGVTGEIYLGGIGLARGYLHQPDLTAERFVPNPFMGADPGARLYRTGDLARYRPDGTIEYLGRIDQQVKLRGFRIELGEIEVRLQSHPAVQEAVVLLCEESEARKYLVVYVVGAESALAPDSHIGAPVRWADRLTIERLRNHLREWLPDYMVPAYILLLERLPLTPNGKVDRKALSIADLAQRDQDEMLVAPTIGASPIATALQEVLGTIWKDVLHLSQISIHDNFFVLGGHSLLATQVIARIRQALEVDLPLRSLFEAPTIVLLAQQLEGFMHEAPSLPVPALVPIERLVDPHVGQNHMLQSFAQERLWFLDQWAPGSAWYNVPLALRLSGSLDTEALEGSAAIVVQRHEILRTTFASQEGRQVQVITPSGASPLATIHVPVIDLSTVACAECDQQVTQLAHAEAQRPFDLANGPLLRMYLLRLDVGVPQEHVLLFTLHHIITDGWSMEVLVREITTLYQAATSGEPDLRSLAHRLLPELPIQYADYAHWQRQWLQGEILDVQLTYWSKQLANLSPLELPTDHLRPAVKTDRGASQSRILPPELSLGLLRLCQKLDVTLFMLLLTTFQVFLMRYTGQTDISVGTPIANRTRTELERMIGCFVNTLVLRTDLSDHPTFEQVLRRVREVCLRAYAHQDLPFEKVVEVLAQGTGPIARDISRTPLFQVMFVLQRKGTSSFSTEQEDLAGVRITPLKVENVASDNATGASKFDLTLSIHETDPEGLHCVMEYSTDLFEADTMTRWLTNFQTLLEGVIQNSQAHVSDLPLLTEVEHKLVTCGLAPLPDACPPPPDVCVHQLFEQQVEQTPDSVALVFEDEILTYTELNRRANHLAYHLQDLGVGPEVLVGICMERSIEMVVGLMGILKAGGAYVPLDPKLPQERFTFLLSDAQVPIVLTQAHLHDLMRIVGAGLALDHKPLSTVEFICLESDTRTGDTRASAPHLIPSDSQNRDNPVCWV